MHCKDTILRTQNNWPYSKLIPNSGKLYIDGRCVQEIAVSGRLEETEVSWNIGRNAEMSFSRFSDMKFGRTRIYGAALSDDDIEALYHAEKDCFR